MAGRKWSYTEFEKLEDVQSLESNTSIHGAITTISPVKRGHKSVFLMERWLTVLAEFDWSDLTPLSKKKTPTVTYEEASSATRQY